MSKIVIYVRNKEITPSSYYRIVQYARNFNGMVIIRDIAPTDLYKKHLNSDENKNIKWLLNNIIYYIIMLLRVTYYLVIDNIRKPEYLIVSKCFCPKYTPIFLKFLIRRIMRSTTAYWDFDDYIIESGEISKSQAAILEKYSKKIIVTSEFLKSTIKPEYRNKVILLPTTDGDMQGFNERELKKLRRSTFNKEIRLVWVATSGNIPHLTKVLPALDKAAKIVQEKLNKKLVLTIVCNKPVISNTQNLNIVNIMWTRERAIEEIYKAHIGIMPLVYTEYALGKGGFKLVQYISTGLPVVASDVGFNKEVVDQYSGILIDDREDNTKWVESIIKIANSWSIWENYSDGAYKRWNEKFSYDYNLSVWNDLLGTSNK